MIELCIVEFIVSNVFHVEGNEGGCVEIDTIGGEVGHLIRHIVFIRFAFEKENITLVRLLGVLSIF